MNSRIWITKWIKIFWNKWTNQRWCRSYHCQQWRCEVISLFLTGFKLLSLSKNKYMFLQLLNIYFKKLQSIGTLVILIGSVSIVVHWCGILKECKNDGIHLIQNSHCVAFKERLSFQFYQILLQLLEIFSLIMMPKADSFRRMCGLLIWCSLLLLWEDE